MINNNQSIEKSNMLNHKRIYQQLYDTFTKCLNPLNLAKLFGVLGTFSIILGCIPVFQKDFFTAGAGIFSAAALFYTAYCYQSDKNNKNSKFYLNQIQKYFKESIVCIRHTDNNNIKWHQGIDCLKTAEHLSKKLTEIEHQIIYITDYINTGYVMSGVLAKIEDYKFFYGLKDFKGKDGSVLYQESGSAKKDFMKKRCYRIEPESLLHLNAVIDKAGKARSDINDNRLPHDAVFSKNYFKKEIGSYKSLDEIKPFYSISENYFLHKTKNIKQYLTYHKNQIIPSLLVSHF